MKRLSLAAAALAVVLSAAACSSSGGGNGSNPPAGSQSTSVSQPATGAATIKNFGYSGDLTVKAGTSVKVVNDDSVAHTLTDKKNHKFDTGNINGSGGTGTFTAPSAPGKYSFGCTIHPDMSGTLTVTS